jgi:hypothetical protein
MANISVYEGYTQTYKDQLRQFWYATGRVELATLLRLEDCPKDQFGRIPNKQNVNKWKKEDMWDFWADDLDARAMTVVEDDLIAQRIEMLKRHSTVGFMMIEKGKEFLASGTFDSSSSAIQAIKVGVEIERTSRGVSEFMAKTAQMDNSAVKEEIMKLISRASENNQIIDLEVEEVPEKKEATTDE